jgi:hypothetical protein
MKDFKWVIQSNLIKDCPVTVDDVITANKIWEKTHCSPERKDHTLQTMTCGQGLCESAQGPSQTPKK